MENKKKSYSLSKTVIGLATILIFFLFLISSDVAIDYMKKGLILCSHTVIPSLFPFMVISELIVSSGIAVSLSRILRKPMSALFGVSEAGAAAFLLGTVCGFPIGAATAASMHDKGIISKGELEHFLIFCNNPGSAFVISAVGASLFGNKSIGLLLYLSVILSSVTVGMIGRFFLSDKTKAKASATVTLAQPSKSTVARITDAIRSSATSMLTVCAYVLFFSALVGCIGALLEGLAIPDEVRAIIFGFFELSSGTKAASCISKPISAIVLCALFLGWSGISVHLQIMTVCSGKGISFKPYLIAKSAQGVVAAAITYIALRFLFPSLKEGSLGAFSQSNNAYTKYLCALSTAFFIASSLFLLLEKLCSKKILK